MRWLRCLPYALLAPVLACYLVAVALPGAATFHDDAIYYTLGEALAQGQGYNIVSLPRTLPETKYPFLYPLLLAPFCRLLPEAPAVFPMLKAVTFLITIAWWYTLWLLLSKRGAGAGTFGWVLLFTAANPLWMYMAASILPDALFALLTTLALICLDRCESSGGDRSGAWRWALLAAAAAAGAFLAKTVGVALLAAGAASLLLRRRIREALIFATVAALLCAPWIWFQRTTADAGDFIEGYYTKDSYSRGHVLAGYDPAEQADILVQNAAFQVLSFQALLQANAEVDSMVLPAILWILFLAGLLASARSPDSVILWVAAYTGVLMCWVWPPARYQAPLFPFFVLFAIRGLRKIVPGRPRLQASLGGLLAGVCLVYAGVGLARAVRLSLDQRAPAMDIRHEFDWSHATSLARWICDNTAPTAVVSGNHDVLFHLLTGRKAIRSFRYQEYLLYYSSDPDVRPVGTEADLANHLRRHRVDYLVVTPPGFFRDDLYFQREFDRLWKAAPAAFDVVHRAPDPRYFVVRVDRVRLADAIPPKPAV